MRLQLILILISILSSELWAQSNIPTSNNALRPALEARVFKRLSKWDHVAEIDWQQDAYGDFKAFGMSSRYHLKHAFMLGIGGRYTWGQRHTDSWIKDPSDNKWKWRDISSEGEFNLELLAQKKWQLTLKSIFELRLSAEHRFAQSENLISARAGITYQLSHLWMSYLRYTVYKNLTHDVATLYKQGLYLGAIYSVNPSLLLGPFIRFERHEWWSTSDFKRITGNDFRTHDNLYQIGVSAIYSL